MSTVCLQEIQSQIEKNIRCDIFYSLWLWAELDIQEASNSNCDIFKGKRLWKKSLLFFVSIYVIFIDYVIFIYLLLFFVCIYVIFRRTSAIALFNAWKILKKSWR